ncbi:MAG: SDR family oxidoreductase [Mariniphaga sp.]
MIEKVIIVTGGAKGIGRKIVLHFLKMHWKCAIWESDTKAIRDMERELNDGNLFIVRCDVSDEQEVKRAVHLTIDLFGRIDVLINNAAISCNKPLSELKLAEWQHVINVNLTGSFLCSKYCEIHLRDSKGSIINICSTRAFQSESNTEAYSASKGGIFALTHALAISLGPDVRVNSISPGWIDRTSGQEKDQVEHEIFTEADHFQHPAGRVGTTDDISNLVWFLAQSENGFITAQNFTIDGGMTRKMIYV